ncbi:Sulfate transporter/antisigma-factor antagonist STAS:sulfate transporter [Caballeronia sordidicola]|uniref:Sulfate transporter/antisigma-factor antagonist STAS:sulfate transporter n=1 Tax=Caballeronia sordidicola TaxID=196367 RepID=A0A226XBS0_CABSO|nr:Sulfate transporter/antisigma-factor antagonist STAS:sulfate transporter [Caballeronia sordidicola]
MGCATLFRKRGDISPTHTTGDFAGIATTCLAGRCLGPITDIDVTAADMLSGLHHELETANIALYFAELKGPVKDRLRTYGLFAMFVETHFFETVTDAVRMPYSTALTGRASDGLARLLPAPPAKGCVHDWVSPAVRLAASLKRTCSTLVRMARSSHGTIGRTITS